MPDSTFLAPGLTTYPSCEVKPLLDYAEYADELLRALASVGQHDDPARNEGDYIIIAGWLLGLVAHEGSPPFFLLDSSGRVNLIDVLKEKARRGVKVYVLGWVSRSMQTNWFTRSLAPYSNINASTLETIRELREDPVLAPRVALNVIAHPAASVHLKVVVIGSRHHAWGSTGGIDLHSSRWGQPGHFRDYWHDVQVVVKGYGVKPLYDLCQSMWHENFNRDVTVRYRWRRLPTMPADAPRMEDFPMQQGWAGNNRVQSMVTLPQFTYKPRARWFVYPSLSFAPQGRFEIEHAIRHAVARAERYIYLECQALWSREIMEWINEVVRRRSGLKVLIVTSGRQDPDDPAFPVGIMDNSINRGLLAGLSDEQAALIRMYRRMRPDGHGIVVHSKTMIIDDRWAYIGSNNVARRSLATCIEHAFSFADDGTGLVKDYRKRLWADQLMLGNPGVLDDLDAALNWWEDWSNPGGPCMRPAFIRPVPLPLPAGSMTRRERKRHETWYDPDSREPWGVL